MAVKLPDDGPPGTKTTKGRPSAFAKRKGRRPCSLMGNRADFLSNETTQERMFRFT